MPKRNSVDNYTRSLTLNKRLDLAVPFNRTNDIAAYFPKSHGLGFYVKVSRIKAACPLIPSYKRRF